MRGAPASTARQLSTLQSKVRSGLVVDALAALAAQLVGVAGEELAQQLRVGGPALRRRPCCSRPA